MQDKNKNTKKNKSTLISFILFLMLFLTGIYFFHPVPYPNESCRFFLISAVVDHGELTIDKLKPQKNDDVSFYNGHYYSNKAIGAPLLGIPVYWVIRNLPSISKWPALTSLSRYFVRIITVTFPYAILGIVLFRISRKMGAGNSESVFMVLAILNFFSLYIPNIPKNEYTRTGDIKKSPLDGENSMEPRGPMSGNDIPNKPLFAPVLNKILDRNSWE